MDGSSDILKDQLLEDTIKVKFDSQSNSLEYIKMF